MISSYFFLFLFIDSDFYSLFDLKDQAIEGKEKKIFEYFLTVNNCRTMRNRFVMQIITIALLVFTRCFAFVYLSAFRFSIILSQARYKATKMTGVTESERNCANVIEK